MKKYWTVLRYNFIAVISIVFFVTSFTGCSSYQKGAFNETPVCTSLEIKTTASLNPVDSFSSETSDIPQVKHVEIAKSVKNLIPQIQTYCNSSAISYMKIEKHIKVAYLTFDDGPSKANTPTNLDTLQKYHIRATFFVLPHEDVDNIYKRIITEGHVIGNHSYSHDYKQIYSSVDAFRTDLLKAKAFMLDKFNYTTALYRFPGGTMGKKAEKISERNKILKEEGYRYFDWSVSDGDCDTGPNGKSPEILAENVLNGTRRMKKIIVLMHDSADKKATTEALPIIIEGLKKQGYVFDVLTNY